jgi:hypothetical protein
MIPLFYCPARFDQTDQVHAISIRYDACAVFLIDGQYRGGQSTSQAIIRRILSSERIRYPRFAGLDRSSPDQVKAIE